MTPPLPGLMIGGALSAALAISCVGCTTFRPIDGGSADLRVRINSGELLKPGDRVRIVTSDQKTHRFTVKSVGADSIGGVSESIPVEQILALEKRQFSPGKTIALVGGLLGGAALGLLVYGLAEYAGALVLR
jgi:hypothetical protein